MRRLFIPLILIVALLGTQAVPAYAANTISVILSGGCQNGITAHVTGQADTADRLGVVVRNARTGTTTTEEAPVSGAIDATITLSRPANTLPGDVLEVTVSLALGSTILVQDAATYTCEQPPILSPYRAPLRGEAALPYLVPGPNGSLPCEVFALNGWGPKILIREQFTNCEATGASAVRIACLNAEGQWTAAHISEPEFDANEIRFRAYQHGHCGVFVGG